ncbi:MAG: hypothetical protein FNT15_00775 [Sulfurovum sp.]|nr:MAG: hypothetical protein FNT15_00775 [Sulfurovum sp.]
MKRVQMPHLNEKYEKKLFTRKDILIISEGVIGQNFIAWIRRSKVNSNYYTINCKNLNISCLPNSNLEYINEDMTGFFKVEKVLSKKPFESIFIIMKDRDEALEILKNVRILNQKVRVIFVNRWDGVRISDDYTTIIDRNEIVASQLYTRLPNIPTIAKDIGLGNGELMEVLIANGTTYAYKTFATLMSEEDTWRIVGVYRKKEFFFPKKNHVIMPNDTLLLAGKPSVLESLYKKINDRQKVFPAPYGKNLGLILNLNDSIEKIATHIKEVYHFKIQLELVPEIYIYTYHIKDEKKIEEIENIIKSYNSRYMTLRKSNDYHRVIEDMKGQEVGVIFVSNNLFIKHFYQDKFYQMKIPVFIFGNKPLFDIKKSLLIIGKKEEMEKISTSVLDIAETFKFELNLCNYSPSGAFEDEETLDIEKHYETIANLFDFDINIEHKTVNPIRELAPKDDILHLIPFNKEFISRSIFEIFSMSLNQQFLNKHKYPKLLIPVDG